FKRIVDLGGGHGALVRAILREHKELGGTVADMAPLMPAAKAAIALDDMADAVLDDSAAPHPGKLLDIEMIAFVGGKERTAEEFRDLLAQAGFRLERI